MSRGIVLWPDAETSRAIRALWAELAAHGLPSLATRTHQRHEPHLSLVVAEELPADEALAALGSVPGRPLELRADAAAVFPGGVLYLTCTPTAELLAEQARVHRLVAPLVRYPWPYTEPGAWTPHLTCAFDLSPDELATAWPLALAALPLAGRFERGGVEDGSTGERWPAPAP